MTESTTPPAPPEDAAPRRRRRRTLPRVIIVAAVVLVLAHRRRPRSTRSPSTAASPRTSPAASTCPGDTPSAGETARPTKEPLETGTLNYVLLGSDSRDPNNEGNGRSDSIMVVHLNAKRNKAYIISFPRDMYVDIPGYGKNKINAAFAFGGAPLTVRTLEDLTGVRMDHVVLVDFEGFIQLTDDLDGVTVVNKTAFTSHGFDYPKGKITIKGEKALWFVRERQVPARR